MKSIWPQPEEDIEVTFVSNAAATPFSMIIVQHEVMSPLKYSPQGCAFLLQPAGTSTEGAGTSSEGKASPTEGAGRSSEGAGRSSVGAGTSHEEADKGSILIPKHLRKFVLQRTGKSVPKGGSHKNDRTHSSGG